MRRMEQLSIVRREYPTHKGAWTEKGDERQRRAVCSLQFAVYSFKEQLYKAIV